MPRKKNSGGAKTSRCKKVLKTDAASKMVVASVNTVEMPVSKDKSERSQVLPDCNKQSKGSLKKRKLDQQHAQASPCCALSEEASDSEIVVWQWSRSRSRSESRGRASQNTNPDETGEIEMEVEGQETDYVSDMDEEESGVTSSDEDEYLQQDDDVQDG